MFKLVAPLLAVAVAQDVDLLDELLMDEEAMAEFSAPAPAPVIAPTPVAPTPTRRLDLDDDDEDWSIPEPTEPVVVAPTPPPAPVSPTSSLKHDKCNWDFFKGRDVAHYDLYSVGVPQGITTKKSMLTHCRTTCENEPQCMGFAWFAPAKKCEFKSVLPSVYNTIMIGGGGDGGHDMHIISDMNVCKPGSGWAPASGSGAGEL